MSAATANFLLGAMLRGSSAWLYGVGVALRNWYYDRGVSVEHARVPVVSVGNITTGGTSKTPMTILLAEMLMQRGIRIAVVARGYRRRSKGVVVVSDGVSRRLPVEETGDELAIIADRLPGVIVIAATRRIEGVRCAVERYNAECVLLDDGFQHRQLYRDMDIVMVDAATLDPRAALLPMGVLREPLASLRRAHVLCCLDRSYTSKCQSMVPHAYVLTASVELAGLYTLGGSPYEFTGTSPAVAVCGIAHPERFVSFLTQHGIDVVEYIFFRDHHWYTARDVQSILAQAQSVGVEWIVTTEKDAIKLSRFTEYFDQAGYKVAVAQIRLQLPVQDGEHLCNEIVNLCRRYA